MSTHFERSVAMTTALLFYAGSAHAQEVVAVPAGEDRIVPVRKGEPAPYTGQLFDNDTSLRWANWIVQYKNLVKSDRALQEKLCAADAEALQTRIKLAEEQYETVTKDLEKKLDEANKRADNPPFYRTSTFGFVVGVVASLGVAAGTIAVVQTVK
jgi:hypothetical protein